MNTAKPVRKHQKPLVTLEDGFFVVEHRGRHLRVPVFENDGEEDLLVELDDITHWAPAEGADQGVEIAVDELGDILEAMENWADEEDYSIAFE